MQLVAALLEGLAQLARDARTELAIRTVDWALAQEGEGERCAEVALTAMSHLADVRDVLIPALEELLGRAEGGGERSPKLPEELVVVAEESLEALRG